jgi:hypothetical protein
MRRSNKLGRRNSRQWDVSSCEQLNYSGILVFAVKCFRIACRAEESPTIKFVIRAYHDFTSILTGSNREAALRSISVEYPVRISLQFHFFNERKPREITRSPQLLSFHFCWMNSLALIDYLHLPGLTSSDEDVSI